MGDPPINPNSTGKLLDRELSKAVTRPVRDLGRPALCQIVDQGLAAFERCNASAEGGDENLGVVFPFFHTIEMLDGAEVLLDAGAVAPAQVVLRAAFESLLALEYVTKADSARRGAAYVVTEVWSRLSGLDRYDVSTQRGKQFAASLAKDEHGAAITIPPYPELEEHREANKVLLEKPHLKAAAAEYQRTKVKLKRSPPFYALWDGPTGLEQLALRLGRSGRYDVLYRQWSQTAHGLDLSRQLRSDGGAVAIARLRSGDDLATTYQLAISFGLEAIRILLSHYRPAELESFFGTWYVRNVRPGLEGLEPYGTHRAPPA